jgi:hypothetical protein
MRYSAVAAILITVIVAAGLAAMLSSNDPVCRYTYAMQPRSYVLSPITKYPYGRIGPEKWQDWYRQVEKTVAIARSLKQQGNDVHIAILSKFKPEHGASEIDIYMHAFAELAPDLTVTPYHETNDTLGQVEKSFALQKERGAELVFISAWLQAPRVKYLAHGRPASYCAVFGIPQPVYAFVDPLYAIFYPILDALHIGEPIQNWVVARRETGKEFIFW